MAQGLILVHFRGAEPLSLAVVPGLAAENAIYAGSCGSHGVRRRRARVVADLCLRYGPHVFAWSAAGDIKWGPTRSCPTCSALLIDGRFAGVRDDDPKRVDGIEHRPLVEQVHADVGG